MTRPRTALLAALLLSSAAALAADDAKPAAPAKPYATDFTATPPGKPPEEIFVLSGEFNVAEAEGNKFLGLAAHPLDTFGVLFGPSDQTAVEVSARVRGTNVGKMFPEFGIGSNDAGGWKLWVLPGQDALAIRIKEVDEVVRVPFKWESGKWTRLKLRVAPAAGGKWAVQGKAWTEGAAEPADWAIQHATDAAPRPGRANAWGQPYSGTPIQFDDLSSTPVEAKGK